MANPLINSGDAVLVVYFRLPLPETFLYRKGMQTYASPLPASCLIQPIRGT